MVRQGFQPLPGKVGKSRRQQHHEQKNPSPQLGFFALQILWNTGASRRFGRGQGHEEVRGFDVCGNDEAINHLSYEQLYWRDWNGRPKRRAIWLLSSVRRLVMF